MQIQIRLATPIDIQSIKILIPCSVRILQAPYYTSEQMEGALGTVFGVDSTLIDDETYYIAELADILVGCGGWSRRKTLFGGDQIDGKDDNLLDPVLDSAKIRAFFVHPKWARQGIGTQLLNVCEQAAVAEGFSNLELVATLAGVQFYSLHGFMETERFETQLPNGARLPVVRMSRKTNVSIRG